MKDVFCRLYVKYLRSLAEKTDLGRLTSPSIMRFVDESMNISGNKSPFDGMTSPAMWDTLERFLEVSIYPIARCLQLIFANYIWIVANCRLALLLGEIQRDSGVSL